MIEEQADDAWERREGTPYPLGVSHVVEEQSLNFALYSKHASAVTLLVYHADDLFKPLVNCRLDPFRNKSGPIWHCRLRLADTDGAIYYAYQIDGPNPAATYEWHSFDPQKNLLDPYARAVFFPPGFSRNSASQPGSNAGQAPLGLLEPVHAPLPRYAESPLRHHSNHIIYEMHVRGFTRHASSGVAEEKRGTFAGLTDKIPYLKDLGITSVELMPVFQFDPQENNYWGYMPLNFFSPHQEYACSRAASTQHIEFREMVEALHAAEIEVILDVVYNHTCEGDESGPCYSFKGIDNSSYYMISGDPRHPYSNYSGTGNTLHTANRAVRRLIMDSLRYWATQLRVDGFRFDLASIFSRRSDGSINTDDPPIFDQIAADAELDGVHLIAEPWDAGGLYQLGSKFPGVRWLQWNARYRDTIQHFVRGDGGLVADVMTRLYGSADLFPDDPAHAYRPYQSINYVTSHDGFTLYDLVSYNQKRNWANGHDNQDGPDDASWNCGCEGDEGTTPEVIRLRKQQAKNYLTLLLLSNGTPMFRMGDEFLQSQAGNNNPYNQDNETTWLDWRRLETNQDVFRFCRSMTRFRKSHPSIARPHFWRDDVRWYGTERAVNMSAGSQTIAFCLDGMSQADDDLYVMINAGPSDARFGIHEGPVGGWRRAIDTAQAVPFDICEPGSESPVPAAYYLVKARSVVVLLRRRAAAGRL
jgi:isoamylase